MLIKKYLSIILLFGISQLKASLMMSLDELSVIDNIISKSKEERENELSIESFSHPPSSAEKILFLSAILYLSPSCWTVWINDRTYTADDKEDKELLIKKVENHYIVLDLKAPLQRSIKLRPNQSFILAQHRIVEGDARKKNPMPIQL